MILNVIETIKIMTKIHIIVFRLPIYLKYVCLFLNLSKNFLKKKHHNK